MVGCIRASTHGQVRDGYSLANQRNEIMRYCTENCIEVVKIYEGNGISGAKVDEDGPTVEREGLQSMLADLASASVDCVVVLNPLRLWHIDMAIEKKVNGSAFRNLGY